MSMARVSLRVPQNGASYRTWPQTTPMLATGRPARRDNLTAEQRSEIALVAVTAREAKRQKQANEGGSNV